MFRKNITIFIPDKNGKQIVGFLDLRRLGYNIISDD
jgi:hypothetical protein